MKNLFFFISLSLILVSCGSSRKTTTQKSTTKNSSKNTSSKKAEDIVSYAKTFKGTKYKFGGTTKKGMDCSGLVYTSFKNEGINLPRISRDMATQGSKVSLNKAHKGDLVFFKTNKNRKAINHVGLVLENKKGELFFIHSTTSQGVIITSLEEKYWKSAFVEARRVL
tara:strand:+ start:918 stop:1418 length:501 start_codon:yes stop_codon:yes gene_type:complete